MKTSICFLGTGAINAKHVRILRKLFPHMRIGIASREAVKAKIFKERFGLDVSFEHYTSAIESDFSTIVIGVPPRYHASLLEQSLTVGKNVVVEKPIVSSLDEFRTLWPLLTKKSPSVFVAENHFFDPFHVKVRRLIETGDLGRPRMIDLVRLGVQRVKGWRADTEEMPLGALHEGGVHWIRRLLDLAGVGEKDPYSSLETVMANEPCPETMVVMARHRSGLTSRLFHSWTIPRSLGLFMFSRIFLESGTITFDPRLMVGVVTGRKNRFLLPCLDDVGGFRTMWRDFIACLEEGRAPALSIRDIFFDFAYLDAAVRSLRTHREEPLVSMPC